METSQIRKYCTFLFSPEKKKNKKERNPAKCMCGCYFLKISDAVVQMSEIYHKIHVYMSKLFINLMSQNTLAEFCFALS